MKNKLLLIAIILSSLSISLKAQNYILNPYNLNVTGMPGDFLLSGLTVTNTNATDIDIFISRIEKTLPQGWTSCFCYPTCLAPWLDTLTWHIPAGTSVDISPNFQTSAVPGFGTVRVELINLTSGSAADTITFTGSTLSSGIDDIDSYIRLYPNPVNNILTIDIPDNKIFQLFILDMSGKEIYFSKGKDKKILLNNIPTGEYVLRLLFEDDIIERKFVVVKQ